MARAKMSKRGDETAVRKRILDAAFAAFMKNGYATTSTLEIATRSRVSKRELYTLVGNKATGGKRASQPRTTKPNRIAPRTRLGYSPAERARSSSGAGCQGRKSSWHRAGGEICLLTSPFIGLRGRNEESSKEKAA